MISDKDRFYLQLIGTNRTKDNPWILPKGHIVIKYVDQYAMIEIPAGVDDGNPPEETQFLGKNVKITLGRHNDGEVYAKGKLLSFSDDGEAILEDEDGTIRFCWPMLEITEDEQG